MSKRELARTSGACIVAILIVVATATHMPTATLHLHSIKRKYVE